IYGNENRSTKNRRAIPYSVFIDQTLSRVGIISEEALENNKNIKEGKLPVNSIPRHKINNDDRGLFKVVVDKDTKEILGASLYGKESEELINIIKIAIDK